jgi:transposase InsO family protein
MLNFSNEFKEFSVQEHYELGKLCKQIFKEYGVTQSMYRRGNCLGNAPIESFFGHMKDAIHLKECNTFEEVKDLVTNYINYYNNERYQ